MYNEKCSSFKGTEDWTRGGLAFLYMSIEANGTAIAIRKEISHKRLTTRTTILEVYVVRKRTRCSIYLPPIDQVTEENMTDLLEQFTAPMILLGNINSHNPLWGSEKMRTRGTMLEWLQINNKPNIIQMEQGL